jgi:hypothetical protein
MAFEFSAVTKLRIFNRQSGVCALCGERGIANYQHIVPRQSGDPTDMMHGWLASDINGVGLCSFDHNAVHIGDDAEFKIRYKTGAIPPASYFEFAFGRGEKADPEKQRAWESEHERLAKPVWGDLLRRYASGEAAKLLDGNMSSATPGESALGRSVQARFGRGGPTIETFTRRDWPSATEMNSDSNKY